MESGEPGEAVKSWGCKYLSDELLDNAPVGEGAAVLGDYLFTNIHANVGDSVSEELSYIVPPGLPVDVQEGIRRINRDYISFKQSVLTDALTWHVQLLEDERSIPKGDAHSISQQEAKRTGMRFLTDTLFLGPEVRALETLFDKSDAIQGPGIKVFKK